jgi:hypothetical protein
VKSGGIFAQNLSETGWSGAGSQPLILRGEQSGLLIRTATTESVLWCTPTKSSARLLNSNLRSALAASCLDEQARFFPHSALSGNRGQGRKLFSRSFLPLFQTCTAKGQPTGGKLKKENKHETSKLNSHSDVDCLHWAFAKSAGSQPAAPRGYPNFTTAAGEHALQALTLGVGNTAIGTFSLFSVTTGNFNTALGAGALDLNTADSNTATGAAALLFNTTGTENTANGTAALEFNATGDFNTANGAFALFNNTDGVSNNALGGSALLNNQIGSANTAIGDVALANNDSDGAGLGNANTAVGAGALFSNTDGDSNNAVGFNALGSNVDGLFNNVMGFDAMADNVSGAGNVAIGDSVGAGVDGDFNIYIGAFAGPAKSGSESETIRIGDVFNTACFIGGIWGQTASGGVAVFIDANGKLGTVTSSARFKDDIKPMGKASEALFSLKPVTFRYKKEIDSKGIPQFGLVAEDVEAFNPDLVGARPRRKTLQRALRPGERDVAQRVSQRALQSRGTAGNNRAAKIQCCKAGSHDQRTQERYGSSYGAAQRAGRANPESERSA